MTKKCYQNEVFKNKKKQEFILLNYSKLIIIYNKYINLIYCFLFFYARKKVYKLHTHTQPQIYIYFNVL